MNSQDTIIQQSEPAPEAQALPPAPQTGLVTTPASDEVSDQDFEEVVRGALEAVGGSLLFKVRVGADDEAQHAAAAAVGLGHNRQFLLLTLPAHGGGRLKVETTSHSTSPLARIAESYAGLMDVLKVAA